MNNEKRKKIWQEIKSILLSLALAYLVYLFIANFIFELANTDGTSMYPTLNNNQKVIASKISYTFSEPKRFDIVIIKSTKLNDSILIKRIVALPGETIQIKSDGTILINDNVLNENYGYEVIENSGIAEDKITLGKDEYFVLGDNRNVSLDSRAELLGPIKRDEIFAKAIEINLFNMGDN